MCSLTKPSDSWDKNRIRRVCHDPHIISSSKCKEKQSLHNEQKQQTHWRGHVHFNIWTSWTLAYILEKTICRFRSSYIFMKLKYLHVCKDKNKHMHVYIYIYIYIHTHTYICIYICVCVCVCIYIYIYIWDRWMIARWQTDRQTDRQTDILLYKLLPTYFLLIQIFRSLSQHITS